MRSLIIGRAWTIDRDAADDSSRYLELISGQALEILARSATGEAVPAPLIVVAGERFVHDADRARVVELLRGSCIAVVLARSFSAGFCGELIRSGVPALSFPFSNEVEMGDELEIDLSVGDVRNYSSGWAYRAEPLPRNLRQILLARGGCPGAGASRQQKIVARRRGERVRNQTLQ